MNRWRQRMRTLRWFGGPQQPEQAPPVVVQAAPVNLPVARQVQPQNGEESNQDNDDDDIPMAAVQFPDPFRRVVFHENAPTGVLLEEIDRLSSLSEDCTRPASACARIVERCRTHPEDVLYICPHTRRQPCHQAALQCACAHVMEAIVRAAASVATQENLPDAHDIFQYDYWAHTPLHMFFQGLKTRQWPLARVMPTLQVLLQATSAQTITAPNVDGYTALHVACQGNGASLIPEEAVARLLAAATPTTTFHKVNRNNEFPLHLHCARRGASVHLARLLVTGHPAALRAADKRGFTPLHHASARCNGPLLEYLIQADAQALRQRSFQGETPLHILCRHKPSDLLVSALRRMIEAAPEMSTWKETRRGCTALHLLCQSPHAPLELVHILVDANPSIVNVASERANEPAEELPLHVACKVGLPVAIVQALIAANPSTVRAVTHKKDTPLSLACSANRCLDTIQLLLVRHPEAAMIANDYGYLPIHCAVRAYQPHRGIFCALLEAAPHSLIETTHGGETAMHLLSNNNSASATLLHDLHHALRKLPASAAEAKGSPGEPVLPTKQGNTPLHQACFRGANTEQLETLIVHHPSWLTIANAGGLTPLQILCKSGRVDSEKLTLFSRLGGPGVFCSVDATRNTPLHSALRAETDLPTLHALIRACPRALHMKTIYDDTPLHLACLRRVSPAVVHAVAVASCQGIETTLANCEQRISPILLCNTAGQTPMAIAMEEYQKAFGSSSRTCTARADFWGDQRRAFDVLSILVKLLHYGPSAMEEAENQNLVFACLCLHRKNVRLPPAFIRRAILMAPEQVGQTDEYGNYPLHVEAGIPVEKMSLLDVARPGCCGGQCSQRSGILRLLLEIYPQAASHRNVFGYFPLASMVQNGRQWDAAFSWVLRAHPQAFHWIEGVTPSMIPLILERVASECGRETVIAVLRSRPDVILASDSSD